MRIFIYSRKSVYSGKGESIENQVEMCRQYIEAYIDGGKNAEISVYEDEGFSGKTLERPQFQKMLEDTKKQKVDYLVCYRLDRISRSVGDFAPLAEDLMSREIRFICIREQFDTSTPMGRAMMYIASVFAQLERETIAQRVRDNMFMLARTGRWLGGTPPTGFSSEKTQDIIIDGKIKTSSKLKLDPAEIQTVKIIYQKYLELRSLSGVSKYLSRENIYSRTGKPYSLAGIKDILQNPVYCTADRDAWEYFSSLGCDMGFSPDQCCARYGLLAYHRRDHSRQGNPRTPVSQWVVAIGKHPGILSSRDWIKTQRLLREKNLKSPRKPPQSYNDYSLLSGRIFCAGCKAQMLPKRRSNSQTLFDYICSNKLKAQGLCHCQNLSGKQADSLVCDFLMCHFQEGEGIFSLLEGLKRTFQFSCSPAADLDALIEKKQQAIQSVMDVLCVSQDKKAVSQHLTARIEELDRQLSDLKRQKSLKDDLFTQKGPPSLHALAGTFADFKAMFPSLTIHEKREFLQLFVQRMEWDGKELHMFLYQK